MGLHSYILFHFSQLGKHFFNFLNPLSCEFDFQATLVYMECCKTTSKEITRSSASNDSVRDYGISKSKTNQNKKSKNELKVYLFSY